MPLSRVKDISLKLNEERLIASENRTLINSIGSIELAGTFRNSRTLGRVILTIGMLKFGLRDVLTSKRLNSSFNKNSMLN